MSFYLNEPDYGAWGAPLNPYTWSDPYSAVANAPQTMSGGAFGGGIAFGNAPNAPVMSVAQAPAPQQSTSTFLSAAIEPSYQAPVAPPPSFASFAQQAPPIQPPAPMQQMPPSPTAFPAPQIPSSSNNPSDQLNLPGPGDTPPAGGLPPGLLPFIQTQGAQGGEWNIAHGQPSPLPMLQGFNTASAVRGPAPQQQPQPPLQLRQPQLAPLGEQGARPFVDQNAVGLQQPQESQTPKHKGGKQTLVPPPPPFEQILNAQGQPVFPPTAPSYAKDRAATAQAIADIQDMSDRIPDELQQTIATNYIQMKAEQAAIAHQHGAEAGRAKADLAYQLGVTEQDLQAELDRRRAPRTVPPLPTNASQRAIDAQNRARRAAYNNLDGPGRMAYWIQRGLPRNRLPGVQPAIAKFSADYGAAIKAEQQDMSLEHDRLEFDREKLVEERNEHYRAARRGLIDDLQHELNEIDKDEYRKASMSRNNFRDITGYAINQATEHRKLDKDVAMTLLGVLAKDQEDQHLAQGEQKINDARLNNMMRNFISEQNYNVAAVNAQTGRANFLQRQKEDAARIPMWNAMGRNQDAMASGENGLPPLMPGENKDQYMKRVGSMLNQFAKQQGW